MSAEKMPVLAGSIKAFELFMSQWEVLGSKHPCLKRFTSIGLQWATEYYKRMDNTNAYVVLMCMYLSFIFLTLY